MSNPDHPEHLQDIIQRICDMLGFPESPEQNGKDYEEKLTVSLYVIWQVLARVGLIASAENHVHECGQGMTDKQIARYTTQWMRGTAHLHDEFLDLVAQLILWSPPKKTRKKKD